MSRTKAGKRDYYEILSVERTASEGEIKSAYRKLALKYHPDRNPGDHQAEERFKECAEAYAVLADPDKRAAYDRFGHAGVASAAGGGFDPSVFTGFEDILGGLGDIFGLGDLFGGARRRGGPQRGADLRYDLEISFEDYPAAIAALRDVARLPNREIALATADIVQHRLGVDLGLAMGQSLPPVQSRQAADVTRRVMSWASQSEFADQVSSTEPM